MEQKYPKYRFVIFILVLFALVAQPFNNFGVSALSTPIIETLGLNLTQFGLLSTLVAFCMGVFAFLGGAIMANIGIKKNYALALGIMAIGGLALGVAAIIKSYPLMLVFRFITGVGFGLMYPVKTAVVMKWFPQKERLLLNALTLGVTYLGLMVLFKWILGIYSGLNENLGLTLIIMGCIAVVAFLLWVIFYRDTYPGLPDADSNLIQKDAKPKEKKKFHFDWAPVKEIAKNKYIRLMTIGAVGHYIAYSIVNTFFPRFFTEKFASIISDSTELAAFSNGIMTYAPLAGFIAIIAAVFIATPMKNRKLFIWPLQILYLIGILGALFSTDLTVVTICQVIIGAASAAWYPAFTTMAMELPGMTPEKVGVAMGFIFGFANFTQFLMGLIGGSIADAFGTGLMLTILSIIGLAIATVCFLFLPETRGRRVLSNDEFQGSGIRITVKKL